MTVTVLDSTDLTGILADAGVELEAPQTQGEVAKVEPENKSADTSAATQQDPNPQEDPDDIEGEDGLTPRQKRELTEKMQRAIGKKHRMQREAEEFAAAQYSERKLAEQRAAALERENAELKARTQPVAKPQPTEIPQPERHNFRDEAAYVDAMIQWGVDKRLAEKAAEDRENAARKQAEQRLEAAASRIREAIKMVPDFEEVVGGVDTMLSPAIATYLEESEMVAELSYFMAKNPDVLESLLKLSPHSQLVKIGKIESTLTPFGSKTTQNDSKSSTEASDGQPSKGAPSNDTGIDLSKPRGKAAPVMTPLDAAGSAGTQKDSRDMNIREAIEDYQKREKANLHVRKRH